MIYSHDGIMTAQRADRIGQWWTWIIGSDTVELHTDFDMLATCKLGGNTQLDFTTWLDTVI